MAVVMQDILLLEQRVRQQAGMPTRVVGESIELLPRSLREAARAQSVLAQLGPYRARVGISRSEFVGLAAPDLASLTVEVGAGVNVGDLDEHLNGWSLTLGGLTPRARDLTVGSWLEGPHAGLRVVPGGRLETAAVSVGVALRGGGVYAGAAAPRSAAGPVLEGLLLGAGGEAGLIVEARLRALPRPDSTEVVYAVVDRPETVVALLREALRREVPVLEAQVRRKARGFAVDLTLAAPGFRLRRDRLVLEEIARRLGEVNPMRRVDLRELPYEGELGWDRLAWAIATGRPLALHRIARESVVVAAESPVKGGLLLDRVPAPLPEALLAALEPGTENA